MKTDKEISEEVEYNKLSKESNILMEHLKLSEKQRKLLLKTNKLLYKLGKADARQEFIDAVEKLKFGCVKWDKGYKDCCEEHIAVKVLLKELDGK